MSWCSVMMPLVRNRNAGLTSFQMAAIEFCRCLMVDLTPPIPPVGRGLKPSSTPIPPGLTGLPPWWSQAGRWPRMTRKLWNRSWLRFTPRISAGSPLSPSLVGGRCSTRLASLLQSLIVGSKCFDSRPPLWLKTTLELASKTASTTTTKRTGVGSSLCLRRWSMIFRCSQRSPLETGEVDSAKQ